MPLPAPYVPPPALRGKVARIDVVEAAAPAVTVLPGTSVVLGVQWRGRVHAPEGALAPAGVTGLQGGARRYAYVEGAASVLVRFTPVGAACLGVPVSELSDRSVPLDALLPPARVQRLHEQLAEAPDAAARVGIVEALLLELPTADDPLVRRALALIDGHGRWDGPVVARLVDTLPISERQLERRFERVVGLTPKRYAALRRFERAVARLPTCASLGALALDAGYYDQAHLNREFRRFTGATPTEVRRGTGEGWSPETGGWR